MNSIIILIQAPADIKYAFELYEKHKATARISMYCINVKGMYDFIDSQKLILDNLVFIPYDFKMSYKNPFKLIKVKRKLEEIFKNYFLGIEEQRIFFFSHFFDFLSFFLLARLSSRNEITFINHYDDTIKLDYSRAKSSLKLVHKKMILRWATNIDFEFFVFGKKLIIEFPYYRYNIKQVKKETVEKPVIDKYSYKPKKSKAPKVLFLEMDYKKVNIHKNYKEITTMLISHVKNIGYELYIKPHPRLGYSKFLNKETNTFVNAAIPAEFIDTKEFDLVIGINSSALAFLAEKNDSVVISLLCLYEYYDYHVKERAVNYLNDLTKKILYPKNISDIV